MKEDKSVDLKDTTNIDIKNFGCLKINSGCLEIIEPEKIRLR